MGIWIDNMESFASEKHYKWLLALFSPCAWNFVIGKGIEKCILSLTGPESLRSLSQDCAEKSSLEAICTLQIYQYLHTDLLIDPKQSRKVIYKNLK